ncbi:MAG: hypothetical protein IKF83_02900 [Clostridia bacterium]|nr:hypothetical protein [Clostridia bacterium]
MSIYPKNISNGENVIIHLRFSNKSKIIQKIRYVLSVIDPDENQVFLKEDNLVLGVEKEEFVKQLYYSLEIDGNFKPGKYIVQFYLVCKGHIIESVTKDNDFFFVEKLEYYYSNEKTVITNISNEKIKFKLHEGLNIEELTINGKEKIELEGKYDYIEYANNKIDLIEEK